MESELDPRDPDLTEDPAASDEDGKGSESEANAGEPVQAAVNHGYNLRPQRTEAGATAALDRSKRNAFAPGVGAEADNNHVGGRDADDAAKRRAAASDSPSPVVRKDGVAPTFTYTRLPESRESHGGIVDRSGGVAWDIPVLRAEGRAVRANENAERRKATDRRHHPSGDADPAARSPPRDLSPRGGEEPSWEDWDASRRARLAEGSRKAPLSDEFLPTNEFARPGNSSRPSVAGRNAKSRREPRATDLLERSAPVEPGRGRKFDNKSKLGYSS